MASDWSPGDRILLYQRDEDIWALPMLESERKPYAVIQTEFDEREGMFSPDGRWMAYVSNSSGRFESLRAAVSRTWTAGARLDQGWGSSAMAG